jgi:hypothetical protein
MENFWQMLSTGMMDVFREDTNRRTPIFRLNNIGASAQEFERVIKLYKAVGGDLNHMDHQGNTVLMWTSDDALGVALVCAGARTYYFRNRLRKRALAMAASKGCCQTIGAIMERDSPDQEYVDRSLHSAALQLSYTREEDMSGIQKLVELDACVNRCGTLARCVDRNPFLVSALITLGASRTMLVWDWQRGVKNTALHRVAETQYPDVYNALVSNLSPVDLDVKDEHGRTPLMVLLSEGVASTEYLGQRFDWLVASGASCLPFDDRGKRVSETRWGRRQPFHNLIAARVREENWVKRRGFLLLRLRDVNVDGGDEDDRLVLQAACLAEFGVFKNIVMFF